jgi:SNF2 family DNA or RNA helicase
VKIIDARGTLLEHARRPCYAHQVEGVLRLIQGVEPEVGRILPGCFALFDEMGAGKTKQVIDAAQLLFLMGEINRVIVVAPAAVRDGVWFNPEFGQLQEHLWNGLDSEVCEYHSRKRTWLWCEGRETHVNRLLWTITNYEYLRSEDRLKPLLAVAGPNTLLILDESSSVKSAKAQQTKACLQLRRKCGRVWLLNGTPISNSPLDMYAQGLVMDPRILDCRGITYFRARYAVMGGYVAKTRWGDVPTQVLRWINLDDLQRRFAPYVLRRLKKDCLDLPPKLPPVVMEVPLSKETWATYQEMKEDFIHWLSESTTSTALQAGVRAMRLAQITSGFLGGFREEHPCQCVAVSDGPLEDCKLCDGTGLGYTDKPPQPLGREKVDLFLDWLADQLVADPEFKLLVWCRFRWELERLEQSILEDPRLKGVITGKIWGGQSKLERQDATRLLHPDFSPQDRPVVVVGIPSAGGMGLNLSASHTVVNLSHGTNLKDSLQSDDRVHRPPQRFPVSYIDLVATGPKGQRTIDHVIIRGLRGKEDLATWTCSAWKTALNEE